jgi:hypothetical protein
MTKKQKATAKTQLKRSTQGSTKTQQHKHEDLAGQISKPSDNALHEGDTSPSSTTSREKHNKKSIRPPVFFHREYDCHRFFLFYHHDLK